MLIFAMWCARSAALGEMGLNTKIIGVLGGKCEYLKISYAHGDFFKMDLSVNIKVVLI
jgi:hypothetical protein